ncbi:MAG: formylglycine-generating enzyme family protein [Treponema sp.]|jgi:formylglycine-generating enzyme required for sulfatase activity|nr:formylglycine-generating enzyme family protein [Treponema sp.]
MRNQRFVALGIIALHKPDNAGGGGIIYAKLVKEFNLIKEFTMRTKRLLWLIAIVALAGFGISACNNSVAVTPVIAITAQPVSALTMIAGNINGNLEVQTIVAGFSGEPEFQWFGNTANCNEDGEVISGATNAVFDIPANLPVGRHYFFVEVRAGTVSYRSNVAVVTVVAPAPPGGGTTTPPPAPAPQPPAPLPIAMVWVPAGNFELGRELGTANFFGGDETPVSTVTLTGFYIGRYLVTQAEFYEVMGFNPSRFSDNPWPGEIQERRPVETVSWHHAIVFSNRLSIRNGRTPAYVIPGIPASNNPDWWMALERADIGTPIALWNEVQIVPGSEGYRLPTEAQWEFAAKGGTRQDPYTFSGSNNANTVAWFEGNSGGMTREVGRLTANGLGIHDMSGNVWEWVWDWSAGHTPYPKIDPTGPDTGGYRVVRGGGFGHLGLGVIPLIIRIVYEPAPDLGFRVASP